MAHRKQLTAKLVRSVQLSDRTKHLHFSIPELEKFDFRAGQFISLKSRNAQGQDVTRAYSIASAPGAGNTFDVCLNRVENAFLSNFLCDMEAGDEVSFHGPHGAFTLHEPLRDSIFIATGTGIAPLRSMIHWIFEESARHRGHHFWLVYGTRHREDVYYFEEFTRLAQLHGNFHYVCSLSRPAPDWQGARGYVQEHVRAIASGRSDLDAYICGLPDMVESNRQLLLDLGWDKKAIHYEKWD